MEESTTLFLGDLSVFCTEKDIRKLFRPFGPIEAIRVKRGSSSKTNLSYGFIKFTERSAAENAYQQLSGVMFMGRALRIGWAEGKGGVKTLREDMIAPRRSETAQIHVSFISKQVDMLISEATLRSLFGIYGEVVDVALKKSQFDKALRVQNGYGFVHYAFSPDGIRSALTAVQCLHQVTIDRVTYDCSISHALQQYLLNANNPTLVPFRTTHPVSHPPGSFEGSAFPGNNAADLAAGDSVLDSRLLGPSERQEGAVFRNNPSISSRDPALGTVAAANAAAGDGSPHFQGNEVFHFDGRGDFHPANPFMSGGYAPYPTRSPPYHGSAHAQLGMGLGSYGYGQPLDSVQRQQSFPREHYGLTAFPPQQQHQQQQQQQQHYHQQQYQRQQQLQQQQYAHMPPAHSQQYGSSPLSSPNLSGQPPSPAMALPNHPLLAQNLAGQGHRSSGNVLQPLAGRAGNGGQGSNASISRPNSATSNGSGPDTQVTRTSSGSSCGNTVSTIPSTQGKSLTSAQEYLLNEEDVPVRYFNLTSLPTAARSTALSMSSTGSLVEDLSTESYSPLGNTLPSSHSLQRESPKVRLSAFPSGVDEDLSSSLQRLGLEQSDNLLNYLHYPLSGSSSDGMYSSITSKSSSSYQLPLSALNSQGQPLPRNQHQSGSPVPPRPSGGGPSSLPNTTNTYGVYSGSGYNSSNTSSYRDLLGTTPPSEQSELDLSEVRQLSHSDSLLDAGNHPFNGLMGLEESHPAQPHNHHA